MTELSSNVIIQIYEQSLDSNPANVTLRHLNYFSSIFVILFEDKMMIECGNILKYLKIDR